MNARRLVLLLVIGGCASAPPEPSGAPAARSVRVEILQEDEHLGHNFTDEGVHTVWIDGCRGRVAGTGEPFVVYWVNNGIQRTPWQFRAGRTYAIRYTGELGTGVMGYQGKCLDLRQVTGVEEERGALSGRGRAPPLPLAGSPSVAYTAHPNALSCQ